ncbi:MAG: DUF1178 family protein [Deltaproteobacteria bacterium]
MIKYSLVCGTGHEFDAWFQNSSAFDVQSARNLVVCPSCGTHDVQKALMSPAVATRAGRSEPAAGQSSDAAGSTAHAYIPPSIADIVRKIRVEIEKRADYVGPRFAEEARKIHYAEAPERGIYGEASPEQVAELDEEGIKVFALPVLPEERN